MVEKEIITKINEFIELLQKKRVRVNKVILYGSRASGKAQKDSDIDIAIISSDFGKNRFKEGSMLFELAALVDTRIEPIPISLSAYQKKTWLPLIYEIRTKGIEISKDMLQLK